VTALPYTPPGISAIVSSMKPKSGRALLLSFLVAIGLTVTVFVTWAIASANSYRAYHARYIWRCQQLGGQWSYTFGCFRVIPYPDTPGIRETVKVPDCD
jgi:hypothetical protein